MIPAKTQIIKNKILGTEIPDISPKDLQDNEIQIRIVKTLFTKNANEIEIINEISQNISQELHKQINVNIKIKDTIYSIKDIHLKGILTKYNEHIYILNNKKDDKIENPLNNSLVFTKSQIETIILSAIKSLNITEWSIGFSLNGFVLFNKPIQSREIKNVDTYDKKEHLIMICENDTIKYYDITEAFPEIANQFKLNLTVSAIGIIVLGGLYTIMNDENEEIKEYKTNVDNQIQETIESDAQTTIENEPDNIKYQTIETF